MCNFSVVLQEHERQLALLERLQRQKLELQHYKQDFEETKKKQEQEAMQVSILCVM